MKERPILFSAPMVRALLDGRKTHTRRIVKHQGIVKHPAIAVVKIIQLGSKQAWLNSQPDHPQHITKCCPYGQPGDRLWVKETWAARPDQDHLPPSQCDDTGLWWKASLNGIETGYAACHGKWRPSMFMPRWASRILLEITAVRVERLQDISTQDAQAEGVGIQCDSPMAIMEYSLLWESINGPSSWDANPWVWAITFRRIEL